MLVIGAGLLVRSHSALMSADPGFEPQRMLTVLLNVPGRLDRRPRRDAVRPGDRYRRHRHTCPSRVSTSSSRLASRPCREWQPRVPCPPHRSRPDCSRSIRIRSASSAIRPRRSQRPARRLFQSGGAGVLCRARGQSDYRPPARRQRPPRLARRGRGQRDVRAQVPRWGESTSVG